MKEKAIDKVIEAIIANVSFILEAGAGAGKTYTLIQAINYILENRFEDLKRSGRKIACITFTNVAKNEITERTENNPFVEVLTIHEFLWSCIANFQSELHVKMEALNVEYERQRTEEGKRKTYTYTPDLIATTQNIKVSYSEYGRNFAQGKLTHEDIILISYYMFRDYPLLSELISSKFPYIFVDEYQDTEPLTIQLLLEHVLKTKNHPIIGFFGDSMQKIYDEGIGEIDEKYYTEGSPSKCLNFITKEENYRCSKSVIRLLNRMRTNIEQIEGPKNVEGSATFFIATDVEKGIEELRKNYGWNIEDANTKILFLTHSSIGRRLGYEKLLGILTARYGQFGRERFFNKEDIFSKFFLGDSGLEKLIENYTLQRYGEVIEQLKAVGFSIINHHSKEDLKGKIDAVNELRSKSTVGDVYNKLKAYPLLKIPDKIIDFESYIALGTYPEEEKERAQKKIDYYNALMALDYKELISAYSFIENKTLYTTKHGTKGDQYENVLLVLDGAWALKYNFYEMFHGGGNADRMQRSLNLFYVGCSRTKNNLAILSVGDMKKYPKAMETLTHWFDDNIIELPK